MDTGELLLRAILTNPADDTARLVYADWLQENGDEKRAGFIRDTRENWFHVNNLWHEISACIPTAKIAGYGREDGTGLPRWTFNLPRLWGKAIWDRGFMAEIHLPLDAFMAHAKALFSTQPITAVTLTDRKPHEWTETHDGPPRQFYSWYCAAEIYLPDQAGMLPRPILPGSLESDHTTREEALAWLSAGCVAYGRSLAGLPPLQQG